MRFGPSAWPHSPPEIIPVALSFNVVAADRCSSASPALSGQTRMSVQYRACIGVTIAVGLLIGTLACGSGSGSASTPVAPSSPPPPTNVFRAFVSGTPLVASSISVTDLSDGTGLAAIGTATAADGSRNSIEFTLFYDRANASSCAGTYLAGPANSQGPNNSQGRYRQGESLWGTVIGGTGRFVITACTQTRVAGSGRRRRECDASRRS
jgi:hypothetical protein